MVKDIEQKYLKKMKELDKDFEKFEDNEGYHVDYDDLIVEFLIEAGLEKLAEAYANASRYFWYS